MEFKKSVKEALEYYVYALVDPRDNKIFYVGKGKGDRVFQHAEDALDEDAKSLKLDTIRAIRKEGKEVAHYILRHKLTEEVAYIVESTLIDLLTYPKINRDNLLTNIVAGHHQWDEGIKTTDEINLLYDCSKIELTKEGAETLLLVSLNKSYDQKKAKGVYKRKSDYEATRKYWRIDYRRIPTIAYVLGVYKGIVRTVYKPIRWQAYDVAEDGTVFNKTRYGFEGIPVPDSPYLNKDISDYPFGSGGAVRYIDNLK